MIDRDKLLALSKNVETLNRASEDVLFKLSEAEKDLQGVGVEAWVEIPSGVFGLARFGNVWRLVFTSTNDRAPTLIFNASRAARIEALEKLDALVNALNDRVCNLIDRAAKAVVGAEVDVRAQTCPACQRGEHVSCDGVTGARCWCAECSVKRQQRGDA